MFLAFKDPVIYLIAIYGSRLVSFLCRIIIARILGPRDYGLWNILVLILIYGNFLHLGLLFALVKEISFCRGKEKWREVDEIRNTVFTSIIIISIIASIIIVISSIFFGKHGSYMFVIFCLIGFILILGQIKNYFLYYFVAENNFKAASASILFLTFVLGSLTTILVIKFRFIGLPLGMALGYPLVLFYIFKKYRPSFGLSINIKRLFSLIKIGFPIMLVVVAYTFLLSIDRALIFKYMGRESLGFYSIVLFLNGFLILFPLSLGIIIFPQLSEEYGALGESKELKRLINMPTVMIAYFMCALAGLIYIFLPTAVKLIIPQYIPGIDAGKIALLGIMFLSISALMQKYLIATNRQTHLLCIISFALILKIILIYIFIRKGMGINGVAIAANIAYFVYTTFIIVFTRYHCKNNFLETIRYFIEICIPFLYLLLILFGFIYLQALPFFNEGNEIVHLAIYFGILVIFVITPFAFVIKNKLSSSPELFS